MNIYDLEKEFLRDKKYKEAAEKLKRDIPFQVGLQIFRMRMAKGISQEKLAKLLHTKQSAIARLEGGAGFPSLRMLKRIADVLNLSLIPPAFIIPQKRKRVAVQKHAYQELRDGAGEKLKYARAIRKV